MKTYIGAWHQGSGKYALYNYGSWTAFVDKWQTLGTKGQQLIDLDVIRLSNGTTRYIGVRRAGSEERALYRYTSWSAFRCDLPSSADSYFRPESGIQGVG